MADVNIEEMTQEQVNELSLKVGDKLRIICEDAAKKANKILKVYGVNAKIAIALDKLPEKQEESLTDFKE